MTLDQWAQRHSISALALSELMGVLSPDPVGLGAVGSSEGAVQKKVRLATNMTGGLLLRNNSGSLPDRRGVPVRFGLGNDSPKLNKKFKSSDLIGLTPMLVGPADVGRTWGVFTAIETKRPGWVYKGTDQEVGQLFFINIIKARGGIAAFAVSPEDYLRAITEFRK